MCGNWPLDMIEELVQRVDEEADSPEFTRAMFEFFKERMTGLRREEIIAKLEAEMEEPDEELPPLPANPAQAMAQLQKLNQMAQTNPPLSNQSKKIYKDKYKYVDKIDKYDIEEYISNDETLTKASELYDKKLVIQMHMTQINECIRDCEREIQGESTSHSKGIKLCRGAFTGAEIELTHKQFLSMCKTLIAKKQGALGSIQKQIKAL